MAANSTSSMQVNDGLPFMVVGVGASAGGLEALNDFFGQVDRTPGVAFIVVQHLSYDFKSMMGQLLSKQTDIKVVNVSHGMAVEPDHVYMLPFRAELKLENGRLSLIEKAPTSGVNHPIDMLFESIAREQKDNSACVILSGSGSDGTIGLRSIKDAGGVVFVQEPSSTQFDSMPHSALATGMVDFIGTPAALAEDLRNYVENPLNRGDHSPPTSNLERRALNELMAFMQRSLHIDFASYKRDGVVRRLQKRLRATHCVSIAEYLGYVQTHPEETPLLEESMLINVTRFLRDNEAWLAFQEECVEPVIQSVPEGTTLRAWVAGCSTGQEAYTMGVLLDRAIRQSGRKLEFRIFATDVDRRAIAKASVGEYSTEEIGGIPEYSIADYFTVRGDRHTVRRSIRDRITFAPHNLMVDPPFTKLHFISCRNLLIYLSQDAQEKVMSRFEFSLLPGASLFLGASETVGRHSNIFRTIDAKWKIFERLAGVGLSPPRTFASALPYSGLPARRPAAAPAVSDALYEAVIQKYVPSGAAIDDSFNIIHVFGELGSVLSLPPGRTTLNLLKMVPEGSSAILSATIRKAIKDREEVCCRLPLADSKPTMLRVVPSTPKTATLVFFETVQTPLAPKPMVMVDLDVETARRIQELEEDTVTLRQSLQTAVQEHEMANEELQATNEELIASNEELQSTNEELQSVNEELYTVNTEYQEKIGELERVNEDLEHVLATTQSGVLILDQDLNIRRYNAGCLGIFPLLSQDVGRPIGDIALRAKNFELEAAMHKLLETGEPFAEDITTDDKRVWGLTGRRLMRKGSDVGIILTITDLSQLRPHLVRRLDRLLTCYSVAGVGEEVPALVVDVDSGESDITAAARRILGLEGEIVQVAEILGMTSGTDRRTLDDTFNKLIDKKVPNQMIERLLPSLGRAQNVTIQLAARISHYNASRVLVALLSERPVVEA